MDAPYLQALHEPSPRLDLVPRHILQRIRPRRWPERSRRLAILGAGAVLVHVGFAAAFVYLLSFRDVEMPREIEIPVEVVHEASGSGGPAKEEGGSPAPAKGDGAKPDVPGSLPPPPPPPRAPAPTGDAKLAAAMALPPAATAPLVPSKPVAPSQGGSAPPRLVAPPEAARSATQDKENKPANLVPDEHQADEATREARPAAVPQVLATADPKAETAVPVPAKPPAPVERPTAPIPAKVPSTADKLAAALPMDSSAMPLSFRSVLAGNAAAQANAAYSGVIQGRIRQAQTELSQTAYAEQLRGSVAITFTIDDAGTLTGLAVVQSSGNAKLDALALHAIELAAPFPPPPPEADRTFNKAFIIGG